MFHAAFFLSEKFRGVYSPPSGARLCRFRSDSGERRDTCSGREAGVGVPVFGGTMINIWKKIWLKGKKSVPLNGIKRCSTEMVLVRQ